VLVIICEVSLIVMVLFIVGVGGLVICVDFGLCKICEEIDVMEVFGISLI